MAIIISGSPQNFTPVYNPIVYYVDSTNKTQDGFKYIADIYSANTTNRIATVKVLPRPNDGLGVFNINQLLENEVSYTIPLPINQFQNVPFNFVKYDVEFGEEYFVNWDFTGATRGPSIFSGLTMLNSNQLQPFGNSVDIVIYTNTPIQGLEGYARLIGSGTTQIVTDVPWDNSYSAATGFVRFANETKTIFPALSVSSGNTAFNGAVSHKDFITYDGNNYTLTGNTSSLLTNVPPFYPIKQNNDMYLQFHQVENTNALNRIPRFIFIKTYEEDPRNGAGQVGEYSYTAATSTLTGNTMQIVNVGPQALEDFNAPVFVNLGTTPIFKNNIKFYSVRILSYLTEISDEYFFSVNKDCFRFNNIELLFQDRLGSLIPANFEVNSIRRINWEQSSYNTYMGDLNNGRYRYNSYERGTNIVNTNVVEELEINSNWIDDDVAEFWQELYTSPLIYIKEDNNYYPVIVKDTSKEILNKNNKKNISYKMTIQYAFNNRIQNGK